MATTQLPTTTGASAATASATSTIGGSSGGRGAGAQSSRQEVQAALGQFDAKINQMGDFPAKDIINALTKLAERLELAQDIVSFLETKIYRVAPQFKLPIFYLTDSILKNVRGPYPSLFGRIIVPLYCNCVKQVPAKDLRRFIHVLNTWEQTRLFAPDALQTMRASATKAHALAGDPSVMAQPASFASTTTATVTPATTGNSQQQQQQDMELRMLLTKLQNDMEIHPTEHLSLEDVRLHNPAYYSQLLAFYADAKAAPQSTPQSTPPAAPPAAPVVVLPPGPVLGGPPPGAALVRGPQAPAAAVRNAAPVLPHPSTARAPPPAPPAAVRTSPVHQSTNVAHLRQLLTRKQAPSPPATALNEITNDPPRAPDAAAVMSILQKLKGLTQTDAPAAPTPTSAPAMQQQQPLPRGPPPPPPAHVVRPAPQFFMPPPPPPRGPMHQFHGVPPPPRPPMVSGSMPPPPPPVTNDGGASRMWFSATIINHKDRVESNVQKLYAALPLVCRDSGVRFKDQDKMNAHLDFLFQMNRAKKERASGGISRSWYVDVDTWVADAATTANGPRDATSSSFFDQKGAADDAADAEAMEELAWDRARVPVDDAVTKCRICGESFAKSWDEDEEDWMYTNAVVGTIYHATDGSTTSQKTTETIFHKYCYDTVTANGKRMTPEHLIRDVATETTTQVGGSSSASDATMTAAMTESASAADRTATSGEKRSIGDDGEDSDSDEDVKRIRTA